MNISNGAADVDLAVSIGRLRLPNPILVASGTFGYAREMAKILDLTRLGGVVPKTVTRAPRAGNMPWRTLETPAGMLNSIGLDNDGIDAFLRHHLPYLRTIGCPSIVSIAGRSIDEFEGMARQLDDSDGIAAIELNVSCPNVSGGVDFGTVPKMCHDVVSRVCAVTDLPVIAKAYSKRHADRRYRGSG